jgi:hypothetical protein
LALTQKRCEKGLLLSSSQQKNDGKTKHGAAMSSENSKYSFFPQYYTTLWSISSACKKRTLYQPLPINPKIKEAMLKGVTTSKNFSHQRLLSSAANQLCVGSCLSLVQDAAITTPRLKNRNGAILSHFPKERIDRRVSELFAVSHFVSFC